MLTENKITIVGGPVTEKYVKFVSRDFLRTLGMGGPGALGG